MTVVPPPKRSRTSCRGSVSNELDYAHYSSEWQDPPLLEEDDAEYDVDINSLMTELHANQSRKVIVPYFGRYKLQGQRGVWQVIGRGAANETWQVAPYEYEDPHKIDASEIQTVHAGHLNFPRNTLLTHINWNLPAFVDGRFQRDRVQLLEIDETCSCEVTVGECPSNSRVIIYASSTLNEGSAVHAISQKKGALGLGAEAILRDCTVVSMYWKGMTNKAPWRIEAPRRVFALISEIVEMHKAYSLRGLLMGCERPDIWGYSRGGMTVISVLRQFTPFAGACFRCATLIAPYFAKTWRNTCIYPYIFDDLGNCPVRIVLGERDSWFLQSNTVIETFVQYQRSKSHLFHQRLQTTLGNDLQSFLAKHESLRATAKAHKPCLNDFPDMGEFEAAKERYAKMKTKMAVDLQTQATCIHWKLDMSSWWRGKLTVIYVQDSDHDQAWQRILADMSFAQLLLSEKGTLERIILQSQRQLHGGDLPQTCVLRGGERELLKHISDMGTKLAEVDSARGANLSRITDDYTFKVFSEAVDVEASDLLPPSLTSRLAEYLECRKDDSVDMPDEDSALCEDYFTYDGSVCFAFRGIFEFKGTSHLSRELGTTLREINRSQARHSMVP